MTAHADHVRRIAAARAALETLRSDYGHAPLDGCDPFPAAWRTFDPCHARTIDRSPLDTQRLHGPASDDRGIDCGCGWGQLCDTRGAGLCWAQRYRAASWRWAAR